MKKRMKQAAKWLKKNEKNIILFFGILCVGAISFEAGALASKRWEAPPLVIEHAPQVCENISTDAPSSGEAQKKEEKSTAVSESGDCLFVGSKNSDKYHSPSCRYAKQIKPENRVCFSSSEDAEKRGYKKGCVE